MGTFNRAGTGSDAAAQIWKVDLSDFGAAGSVFDESTAKLSVLANLTNVGFLNGATTWGNKTVLVADSVKGVVYAIDSEDGSYAVALNNTELAPNATGAVRLGVNGLVTVNDTLYYTNTNHRSVGKVQLAPDGTAAGPYETLATNILVDDLEVDSATGAIFIPGLVGNIITYVAPNGISSVIAGSLNSTEVPGPTSLRFARIHGIPGVHTWNTWRPI